jgi:hypothetical protein
MVVLAAVFAAPALMCVHHASASDLDVWWHLRTGEWIVQHHAVPHADPFSWTDAGKPWQAYSWLFDLLTVKLFQRLGLAGFVALSSGMVLAITVAFWHLTQRLQRDFSNVALLTFAACFSLGRMFTPRPWLFTILFFILELDILMQARRTGRTRELAWLPLIFALWANIHIEFIDGLLVLGLAAAEAVATRWGIGVKTCLRAPWILAAFIGSVFATLINPYGCRVYGVIFDYVGRLANPQGAQSGLIGISELLSLPFRNIADFCVLFLALGAAAALAWNRRFKLFEVMLLVFAAVVSFHSQRDIWVMIATAIAILASNIAGRPNAELRLPRYAMVLSGVCAVLLLPAGFRVMRINNAMLKAQVRDVLPEAAADAIQEGGYPGPLYNDFNWGGYLMWKLRVPVSIDGRAALYGDGAMNRSLGTWSGGPNWASDPALKSAGVVIGPMSTPLVQLLKMDPRFRLVFEDQKAAVLVARR